MKLHVLLIGQMTSAVEAQLGAASHSGFAVSEAGEKIVDCAGMPLTAARRANSAGIESVGDLAKGREPGSLNRSSSRTPTAPQCDLPQLQRPAVDHHPGPPLQPADRAPGVHTLAWGSHGGAIFGALFGIPKKCIARGGREF